jgi:hypothetical protein
MLAESPNNAFDIANDRIEWDRKEIIIPAAVADTASASASSLYLDTLATSNRRVANRDAQKRRITSHCLQL